jgi:hypothetical protein
LQLKLLRLRFVCLQMKLLSAPGRFEIKLL